MPLQDFQCSSYIEKTTLLGLLLGSIQKYIENDTIIVGEHDKSIFEADFQIRKHAR